MPVDGHLVLLVVDVGEGAEVGDVGDGFDLVDEVVVVREVLREVVVLFAKEYSKVHIIIIVGERVGLKEKGIIIKSWFLEKGKLVGRNVGRRWDWGWENYMLFYFCLSVFKIYYYWTIDKY